MAAMTPNVEALPRPAAERLSHHVYGRSGALCVVEDQTRAGVPTVRLEGAKATAPRVYDWKQKVAVQLTAAELLNVAAVLLRYQETAEASAHGEHHDKGFALAWRGDDLICRLNGPGRSVAVKISPADQFHVTALLIRQIRQSVRGLSDTGILALLRKTHGEQAR